MVFCLHSRLLRAKPFYSLFLVSHLLVTLQQHRQRCGRRLLSQSVGRDDGRASILGRAVAAATAFLGTGERLLDINPTLEE